MNDNQPVKVLTCAGCAAPVVAGTPCCNSCGVPVGGVEVPYVARQEARPEVGPLFKWWAICSMLIWIFSGLKLGTVSSLLLAGASIFFMLKIMRTYFSDL